MAVTESLLYLTQRKEKSKPLLFKIELFIMLYVMLSNQFLPPALRAVGSESLRPYGSETRRDYFVNILIMYVYLLQSFKDKKYYIGQADNIKKRLKEHNEGKVRSTKHRIPFRLIGYEEYPTRNEARWREYNLKKSVWQRKKFLEKLTKK